MFAPVSVVVPAPLCVSESVPEAFERTPESVLAFAEFTITLPAPPSVLPMLFASAPVRFTSVSTPPVPTFTDVAPPASMRLGNAPVPMVSPPALTVTLPLMPFVALVSVVVPEPVCWSAIVPAEAVIGPASVLLFCELTFTVPTPPNPLVMESLIVFPTTFTSARVPPL